MLDIQSGKWIEVTFIEGYEPKCTLSNILYGIMYRFRVVALNDAGSSEPGEPSEPIVIDVPGVQIAPYFVQMLNDTIALEHEKVYKNNSSFTRYIVDKQYPFPRQNYINVKNWNFLNLYLGCLSSPGIGNSQTKYSVV